jgi:hypothetical protein
LTDFARAFGGTKDSLVGFCVAASAAGGFGELVDAGTKIMVSK